MISSIPTELRLVVLSYLDKAELAKLRLCSRSMNDAAKALYHEKIYLEFTPTTRMESLFRIIAKITNLLTANPELAKVVKIVTLDGDSIFRRLRAVKDERQRNAPHNQTINPARGMIYHETRIAEFQTAIAGLLQLCSNLRELDAQASWITFQPFWNIDVSKFQQLQTLVYDAPISGANGCAALAIGPPLFYNLAKLPNLRHLRIGGRDLGDEFSWTEDVPTLSSLRYFEFKDVQIREDTVVHALSTTPNLQQLSIHLQIQADPGQEEARGSFLDCPKLGVALGGDAHTDPNAPGLKHPEKLESLLIELTWFTISDNDLNWGGGFEGTLESLDPDDVVEWGIKGKMGSLTYLTNLKRLQIAPPVLFGWDPIGPPALKHILPPNLEEVVFSEEMCTWKSRLDRYRWHPLDNDGCALILDSVGPYLDGTQPPSLERVHFRLGKTEGDQEQLREAYDKTLDVLCGLTKGTGREVDVGYSQTFPGGLWDTEPTDGRGSGQEEQRSPIEASAS